MSSKIRVWPLAVRLYVAGIFFGAAPIGALATDYTWTGLGGNTSWHTVGNWSPSGEPGVTAGNNDTVMIPSGALGAMVGFSSGTRNIANITCDKPFQIIGGILNINSITVASTFSNTLSMSAGTLGGAGQLTVSGLFSWTGGTLSGTGPFNANGGIAMSGGSNKNLFGRTVTNTGTATYSGNGFLIVDSGAVWNNAPGAIFEIQNAVAILSATPPHGVFNNNGLVRKTGGGQTDVSMVFNNAAAAPDGVDVQLGILSLNNGGVHAGGFRGPSALRLGGGTHDFQASSAISAAGLLLAAGACNVRGLCDLHTSSATVTGGAHIFFPDASVTGFGQLSVNNGTLTLNSGDSITAQSLVIGGGTLSGGDSIAVSGAFVWTGGTLSGSGALHANGGITMSGSSNKNLFGRAITNTGTATLSGNGFMVVDSGAVWNNSVGAVLEIQNVVPIASFTPPHGVLNNLGTLRKTSTGDSDISTFVTNSGLIEVDAGRLRLTRASGLTNFAGTTLTGGTYEVSATLQFAGANIVTNAATIILDGPASAIQNTSNTDALANFSTNAAAGSFRIKNGRNFARTGIFSNAGALMIGPGASTLSATGNYVQTAGGTTLDGGTLDPTPLADIQGGELKGNGSILANVSNAGTCKVGMSPGSISITGDYSQTAAGTFDVEIGGLTPGAGGYDQLVVSGSASLAGTLDVALFGSFAPSVADSFDIIVAGTRTGTFDTHNLPLAFSDNCKGEPEYGPTFARIHTYAQVMITDQPDSQAICSGSPVTFAVVAAGSGPFSYQWRKGGVDIPGETANSYTDANVQPADAGDYDVIVTNVCGFENSVAATLTVNIAPSFSDDPDSQTICSGSTVNFSVSAAGIPAPTLQWRKNNINILDATGPTLILNNVQPADAGIYDCVANNVCGSPASAPAVLTVNTPAEATDDPDSVTICSGSDVTFAVTASGTPAPTYQWRKNTVNIDGETSSTLNLPNVQPADAGSYDCVVTNICATDTSAPATLTINVAASISDDPDSQAVCAGGAATFSVVAHGTPAPTYQWRKGGVDIGGANGSSLVIDPVAVDDAGSYDCVVTNVCATVTSASAVLTVNSDPTFIQQPPVAAVACVGGSVSLSVTAGGIPAPSYQWRRNLTPLPNGGNISGANSAVLMISPVALADTGAYDCVTSNVCSSLHSDDVTLTVFASGSGDVNGDSLVNGRDIQAFVSLIISGGQPSAPYCSADKNTDGVLNLADVPLLVAELVL